METEKILKLLKEHKVVFVIIGATAFPVHGYSRATLDIDIFIKPERRNAERTMDALKAFGYDMVEVTVDDLLKKKLLIRQYTTETDIHPFVKGVTFETVWKNRVADPPGLAAVRFSGACQTRHWQRQQGGSHLSGS